MSMQQKQEPQSPMTGIGIGLGAFFLVLLVDQGFGGAMSCGTWGFDCGFKAVLLAGLLFPWATVLLWRAYTQATPGESDRWLSMLFFIPCALASLAALGFLGFLLFAIVR